MRGKCHFTDRKVLWGQSVYMVSIHRPFHSQVTEGRERSAGKEKIARPREQGRCTPRVPAPPLHPSTGASPGSTVAMTRFPG